MRVFLMKIIEKVGYRKKKKIFFITKKKKKRFMIFKFLISMG